jgi:hypothetical protein
MKTYSAGGREPSEVRTNSVVDVSNLMITLAARKSTFLRRAYRAHGFSAPDGTCDISTSGLSQLGNDLFSRMSLRWHSSVSIKP